MASARLSVNTPTGFSVDGTLPVNEFCDIDGLVFSGRIAPGWAGTALAGAGPCALTMRLEEIKSTIRTRFTGTLPI
jgi:hypothetical protein